MAVQSQQGAVLRILSPLAHLHSTLSFMGCCPQCITHLLQWAEEWDLCSASSGVFPQGSVMGKWWTGWTRLGKK